MPCIQIKTNVKVNEETAEAIKSQLGKDIALLPEKTEDWLMVTLAAACGFGETPLILWRL